MKWIIELYKNVITDCQFCQLLSMILSPLGISKIQFKYFNYLFFSNPLSRIFSDKKDLSALTKILATCLFLI